MSVISYFLDLLFPPRPDELLVRDVSTEDINSLLVPQVAPITRPETIVLFSFTHPSVRALIHEAKYHGNERAFTLLAHALSKYLQQKDDSQTNTIIVPIPLGSSRRKERGFNQIEEIVYRALGTKDLPIDAMILKRTRETLSQTTLPRHKREENMRGAFATKNNLHPAHTYIVIDDVVTTGATLQAAIDALKKAGAKHIVPLALAH